MVISFLTTSIVVLIHSFLAYFIGREYGRWRRNNDKMLRLLENQIQNQQNIMDYITSFRMQIIDRVYLLEDINKKNQKK